MDSSFEGCVLDPVKFNKVTMEGRREIVYEVAKWSHGATDLLLTWSRQDILQILCAEMGKERKYTGLTKSEIIERLLKIVSEKNDGDHHETAVCERPSSHSIPPKSCKRPRKPENPSRLLVSSSATNISSYISNSDSGTSTYCKNSACKARLNNEDMFCKRCTCCICHKYDDNKDPSIWLTCSSEPPFPGDSCNMSCHLECALKHERAGISRHGVVAQLDGSFYCISCGKMNDLMSCWRKQLIVARETRKVDILCYRISLSQKLLSGTRKYRKLSEIVDDAVRVLEAEVGTFSGGPVKMGRGIVNRLSSGQEVQRLCSSAVESFDLTCDAPSHQELKTANVPSSSGMINTPATNSSSLSNPSSVEDETNNIIACCDLNENKTEDYFNYYKTNKKTVDLNSSNEPLNSNNTSHDPSFGSNEENAAEKFGSKDQSKDVKLGARVSSNGRIGEAISTDNGSNNHRQLLPPYGGPESSLPITPSRKETSKDGNSKKGGPKPLSKSKEKGVQGEKFVENVPSRNNLEYYIKVIRWLECEGHIDKSFRQKFLTWYSIRATPQEIRIVKAFVDTLIEDPASLSEQLVDTFGEIVSSKKSSDVPHGFCLKLWH